MAVDRWCAGLLAALAALGCVSHPAPSAAPVEVRHADLSTEIDPEFGRIAVYHVWTKDPADRWFEVECNVKHPGDALHWCRCAFSGGNGTHFSSEGLPIDWTEPGDRLQIVVRFLGEDRVLHESRTLELTLR